VERFAPQCPERVDVLVNNAGVMFEASIDEQSVEQRDRAMAVNLRGPWLMVRGLLTRLERASGAVVNIGSIEGLASNPLHTANAASKGGVNGLTVALAVDLEPRGAGRCCQGGGVSGRARCQVRLRSGRRRRRSPVVQTQPSGQSPAERVGPIPIDSKKPRSTECRMSQDLPVSKATFSATRATTRHVRMGEGGRRCGVWVDTTSPLAFFVCVLVATTTTLSAAAAVRSGGELRQRCLRPYQRRSGLVVPNRSRPQ
jgi:hypothetical protein